MVAGATPAVVSVTSGASPAVDRSVNLRGDSSRLRLGGVSRGHRALVGTAQPDSVLKAYVHRDPCVTSRSRGGGVLIGVKTEFCSTLMSQIFSHFEEVWVFLTVDGIPLIVGAIYFPPGFPPEFYSDHVRGWKHGRHFHLSNVYCLR